MFHAFKIMVYTAIVLLCAVAPLSANTISYEADSTTNFPNPERGYAVLNDPPWPAQITWDFCGCEDYTWSEWTEPVAANDLAYWRGQGWSLYMIRYHIAEFRETPISDEFLERLESDLQTIREQGFKMIPRFVYNWPMGGPDAPLSTVLMHIEQLKPVLTRNIDVIAYIDLGFIGCWGENHTSCYGLVDYSTPNKNSWKIIDSLFAAVPTSRMIAVRYPKWKFRYFGNMNEKPIAPLTETEAYSGTKKARWAHHDDCPTCGEWNCGTWQTQQQNPQELINFLAEENLNNLQSGEPGDPETGGCGGSTDEDGDGWSGAHHADCDRMLWLYKTGHWSVISGQYGENPNNRAYQIWKEQGCYTTIAKKLGYRFRLTTATIPSQAKAGETFSMRFNVTNDGWASPYNPRGLEIVLRNHTTHAVAAKIVLCDGKSKPADLTLDPRFWKPGTTTVNVNPTLPADLPAGEYQILLHLFDPEQSLYARPEYAIRLANTKVWEGATGYNNLLATLTVDKASGIGRNLQQPEVFQLSQNHPNPFNPSTMIEYSLPISEQVMLKVFDVIGNEVRVLVNSRQAAGSYRVQLDSNDLNSGLYFYLLQAGKFTVTKKMILIK